MLDSPYTVAMEEGARACKDGQPKTANPYCPYFASLGGAWNIGWDDQDVMQQQGQDSHLLDSR